MCASLSSLAVEVWAGGGCRTRVLSVESSEGEQPLARVLRGGSCGRSLAAACRGGGAGIPCGAALALRRLTMGALPSPLGVALVVLTLLPLTSGALTTLSFTPYPFPARRTGSEGLGTCRWPGDRMGTEAARHVTLRTCVVFGLNRAVVR